MKIYKIKSGIVIENSNRFYLTENQDWDEFINNDDLEKKVAGLITSLQTISNAEKILKNEIVAPIGSQELWACGVTYLRSKTGREEESKDSGAAGFYAKVYEAERPEVFFKTTAHRVVGHGGKVRIRKDSAWNVPEPELTLLVTSSGKIIGYTIGNDMSSRSIEGENPLYLPQAKTYDGCAAIGPSIYVTEKPLPPTTMISLAIIRNNENVFSGNITIDQMKRTTGELVSFVYRECSFPNGAFIMTGTGIVPGADFTLKPDDEIKISIEGIGELVNQVK